MAYQTAGLPRGAARRRRLAVSLPRHADEHRPERPVLVAVDQQLGEGAGLRVARTRPSARRARGRAVVFDFDDTLVPDSTSKLLRSRAGLSDDQIADFWRNEAGGLVKKGYDDDLGIILQTTVGGVWTDILYRRQQA